MDKNQLGYVILASVILVAILLGGLFLTATDSGDKRPKVGVIEIDQPILTVRDRNHVDNMISYVMESKDIEAVVLRIDCPGGYASGIEEIYNNLLSLKKEKPIVTSVGSIAASGGYYIAVASDYIYASSSSMVGNIGVISSSPPYSPVSEKMLETGPYKRTGASVRDYPKTMETIFQSFVGSVENQRQSELTVSTEKIVTGKLFVGDRAAKYGLIDGAGSLQTAVKKCAGEAGIKNYEIMRINKKVNSPRWWSTAGVSLSGQDRENREYKEFSKITLSDLENISLARRHYYLFSPDLRTGGENDTGGSELSSPDSEYRISENMVLVDYSHMNAFQPEELNVLLSELSERNFVLKYIEGDDWSEKLSKAGSLLVINPTVSFTGDEIMEIENFVEEGGKIMLVNDPSRTDPNEINSLATRFGHTFARGYLYSLSNYYGVYKNIYLNEFKDENITKGVERLLFLTSTQVYSRGEGIAFADDNLYNSRGEKRLNFSPIALGMKDNLVSVGDLSFLCRPYSNLESNLQFISNLANFLANERVLEVQEKIKITNLKIDPEKASPGENVTISVDAKNLASIRKTKTISLRVNDKIVENRRITLAPEESETVNFEVSREDTGTYKVNVDGLSGSFEVTSEKEEYETFTSENYNFSFSYPDNWSIEIENTIGLQDNRIVVSIKPPEKFRNSASGQVTAGKLDYNLDNIRRELERMRGLLENRYSDNEIIEIKGPENIERNQIRGVTFQYLIEGYGYSGMIFFKSEKYSCNLTIYSEVDTYKTLKNSIKHIMKSFTPLPD